VDLLIFNANVGGAGGDIFAYDDASGAAYSALADQACTSLVDVVGSFYRGEPVTDALFKNTTCHGKDAEATFIEDSI